MILFNLEKTEGDMTTVCKYAGDYHKEERLNLFCTCIRQKEMSLTFINFLVLEIGQQAAFLPGEEGWRWWNLVH